MKFTAVAIVLLVAVVAINAIPLGDSNYNRNVNNNNNQDRLYSSLYNQLIAQQSGKGGPDKPPVAEDEVSADDDAPDGEANIRFDADGHKSHNPDHPSSNYNYNSNSNNNQNIIDSFLLSQLYSQLINNQGTPGHGIH